MTAQEKKEILRLLKEADSFLDTVIPEEELDLIQENLDRVKGLIEKMEVK